MRSDLIFIPLCETEAKVQGPLRGIIVTNEGLRHLRKNRRDHLETYLGLRSVFHIASTYTCTVVPPHACRDEPRGVKGVKEEV